MYKHYLQSNVIIFIVVKINDCIFQEHNQLFTFYIDISSVFFFLILLLLLLLLIIVIHS